jgi:large subunit ribosomal protein L9
LQPPLLGGSVEKFALGNFCSLNSFPVVDTHFASSIIQSAFAGSLLPRINFYSIMPFTEIILTENVPGLGAEADVVKVRRGYARNFLLPKGKGYEVTPASLRQVDNLKAKRAEREAREMNEAEDLARRINKLRVTFTLETGETGKAFGSITAQDLVNRIKNELGNDVDRHKISLEHPIKTTGEHEVSIKLHHDVVATFRFQVKSSNQEPPKTEEPIEAAPPKRGFFRKRTEQK